MSSVSNEAQPKRHSCEYWIAYTSASPVEHTSGREAFLLPEGEWQVVDPTDTDQAGGNSELFRGLSIDLRSNDPELGDNGLGTKSNNPAIVAIEAPWLDDDGSRGYVFELVGILQKADFRTDASVGAENAHFGKQTDNTVGMNRTILRGTFSFPVSLGDQELEVGTDEGKLETCQLWDWHRSADNGRNRIESDRARCCDSLTAGNRQRWQ